MLTDTKAEINVNLLWGSRSCELRLLAVGGGGGGEGYNAGGGSGYILYETLTLDQGLNIISAQVGADRQASTVKINGDIILTAESGRDTYYEQEQEHYYYSGGDGYSGGGGGFGVPFDQCDGGSDGGSGKGPSGGSGTGEDIRDYTFTSWILTPGAGGNCFDSEPVDITTIRDNCAGGGGGGVMVEGAGPEASLYQGQGYGGGGGSPYPQYGQNGLQGVILLEVVSG